MVAIVGMDNKVSSTSECIREWSCIRKGLVVFRRYESVQNEDYGERTVTIRQVDESVYP
jgi:hypothetical protein